MKQTIVSLLAIAAGITCASARTDFTLINLNFPGGPGIVITDNSGDPVSTSWAVGTFSGAADFNSLDGVALGGEFTPVATGGGFTAAGVVNQTISATLPDTPSTASPIGEDIYFVIGNDATFGNSTDWIIFQFGQFQAENGSTIEPEGIVTLNIQNDGTRVRGLDTTGQNQLNPAWNGLPGVTFGAIPEPSTSLLAGFAGLALLIRRKR